MGFFLVTFYINEKSQNLKLSTRDCHKLNRWWTICYTRKKCGKTRKLNFLFKGNIKIIVEKKIEENRIKIFNELILLHSELVKNNCATVSSLYNNYLILFYL